MIMSHDLALSIVLLKFVKYLDLNKTTSIELIYHLAISITNLVKQ